MKRRMMMIVVGAITLGAGIGCSAAGGDELVGESSAAAEKQKTGTDYIDELWKKEGEELLTALRKIMDAEIEKRMKGEDGTPGIELVPYDKIGAIKSKPFETKTYGTGLWRIRFVNPKDGRRIALSRVYWDKRDGEYPKVPGFTTFELEEWEKLSPGDDGKISASKQNKIDGKLGPVETDAAGNLRPLGLPPPKEGAKPVTCNNCHKTNDKQDNIWDLKQWSDGYLYQKPDQGSNPYRSSLDVADSGTAVVYAEAPAVFDDAGVVVVSASPSIATTVLSSP
jgi:hypothetical protein